MRWSAVVPVLALSFTAAACGESPTAVVHRQTQINGMTREKLLADPLTLLLQSIASEHTHSGLPTAPGLHADIVTAPVDAGDSVIVAATLELIIEAANNLPSDSSGH